MWLCVLLFFASICVTMTQNGLQYPPSFPSQPSPPGNPPAPIAMMAHRFLETLPNLPNVIQGHMTGNATGLKQMVSQVLGNGLLSQLVVDPMKTAEEMGVSVDALGINKTDVMAKLNNATNGFAGTYLGGQSSGSADMLSNLFTTTEATTPMMYIDGRPIDNLDEFIRSHNFKDQNGKPFFKNQRPHPSPPIPSTTPTPSAQEIAESVLVALKRNGLSSQSTPTSIAQSRSQFDPRELLPENFEMNLVDPNRVDEVNHLLRRAPQKFDTLTEPNIASMPVDPEIDNVLTTLRTKSFTELSVDQVKKLQTALQQYEQKLQTKELFTKRKQLQVLQTELLEQKKRIEQQRKLEEELRKKEKELEEKRLEMELQLQKQLNSWHSSFSNHPPGVDIPTLSPISFSDPMEFYKDLPQSQEAEINNELLPPAGALASPSSSEIKDAAPPAPPPETRYYSGPTISVKPSNAKPFEVEEPEEPEEPEERSLLNEVPTPVRPVKSPLSQLRYSAKKEAENKNDPIESNCECITISMEKMMGRWYPALSAKKAALKTQKLVSGLIGKIDSKMKCSMFEFLPSTTDPKVRWHFRTIDSSKTKKISGSVSTDGLITDIQFESHRGNNLRIPLCVLKTGGSTRYEYMVTVNASGPCNEATLYVRDLNTFFDRENFELMKYLKHKINQKEMDSMDILPYAGVC